MIFTLDKARGYKGRHRHEIWNDPPDIAEQDVLSASEIEENNA